MLIYDKEIKHYKETASDLSNLNGDVVKLDFLTGTINLSSTLENAWGVVDILTSIDKRFVRENWQYELRGVNRYNNTLRYADTGFFVACNPDSTVSSVMNDMKIFVCLSGSAIDLFGSDLVLKMIKTFDSMGFNCSRCDLAYDVLDNRELIDNFKNAFRRFVNGEKNIVTKIHPESFKIAQAGRFGGEHYENWTVGARSSSLYYRFYDKRVERKLRTRKIEQLHDDQVINDDEYKYLRKRSDFWYRIEIELKGTWAKWIFPNLLNDTDYGAMFGHTLLNSFRVIDADNSTFGIDNAYKNQDAEWYTEFVGNLQKAHFVQLPVSQKVIKNIMNTLQWAVACSPVMAVCRLLRVIDLCSMSKYELDALEKAYKNPIYKATLNRAGYFFDGKSWTSDCMEALKMQSDIGMLHVDAEEFAYV